MNIFPKGKDQRRWFAPEVVQTSTMDCGPATLKCLLEGFHIHASYGRLREACQTSVDGTSIDVIETVARQLGLDAEQCMLPMDYLWLAQAKTLPATIVVRQPEGATHFVVVWRRCGHWLQIMDPAVGRRWITCERFARDIFLHSIPVPAVDWREWATSSETLALFVVRLRTLGASQQTAKELIKRAQHDLGWHSIAALDAAIRLLNKLVAAKGLQRGAETMQLLSSLLTSTAKEIPGTCLAIPARYWSVKPTTDTNDLLLLSGAVLLQINGRLPLVGTSKTTQSNADDALSPELAAALNERPLHPARELWALIRLDGLLTPLVLVGVAGLAMGAVMVEALLFRGLFEIANDLNVVSQRAAAFAALLLFVALLWALELPVISVSLRLGRHLETRLRLLLMEKLPKLNDRYLQSRPISDMAERSHSVTLLRNLPEEVMQFVRSGWELLFTLVGIGFIAPQSLVPALAIVGLVIGLSVIAHPLMSERDLRVRSHSGALQRFYLDALLGIVPIRTHSAERAVRRGHESLLAEWARSAKSPIRLSLLFSGLRSASCLGLAGWLLFVHIQLYGVTGILLLLVYWVLKLPALGEQLASLMLQYPTQRNITLRLLEPINAPEEGASPAKETTLASASTPPLQVPATRFSSPKQGCAIDIRCGKVIAAGHTILQDIQLCIQPGEHVAIVGPSGAGKSSLLGLLLGWHHATDGQVLVDGHPLRAERLLQLRRETAWLDPAIQIWNRSLLENLRYSPNPGPHSTLGEILEQADLTQVLSRATEGLQSPLGEGGAHLSGGEGQRVRLARAMWQQGVRLALLDEPFRGLDRTQRHHHLNQVRHHWRQATLICVTHDIEETRSFKRVIVVEHGRIIEDGSPDALATNPKSRYHALLTIEASLRQGGWNTSHWRRLRLDHGRLREDIPKPAVQHD